MHYVISGNSIECAREFHAYFRSKCCTLITFLETTRSQSFLGKNSIGRRVILFEELNRIYRRSGKTNGKRCVYACTKLLVVPPYKWGLYNTRVYRNNLYTHNDDDDDHGWPHGKVNIIPIPFSPRFNALIIIFIRVPWYIMPSTPTSTRSQEINLSV